MMHTNVVQLELEVLGPDWSKVGWSKLLVQVTGLTSYRQIGYMESNLYKFGKDTLTQFLESRRETEPAYAFMLCQRPRAILILLPDA